MTEQRKRLPYLKVFGDWLCRFQTLDDAQFGRFIRAAIAYVCAGEEPKIDGVERLSFDFIRPALDSDVIKYQDKVQKNTMNGSKGASVRWGTDDERHLENSERYISNGKNSQEEERGEKREEKEKREKREDTRGGYRGDKTEDKKAALQEAWRRFNAMRSRIGRPVSEIDQKGILTRLKEYGGDDIEKCTKMLNMAADKEWLTVFPLEEESKETKKPTADGIIKNVAERCTL